MKISSKLYIVFSVFILILIAEILLNQVITQNAKETNQVLTEEIDPFVKTLEKYKSINTELYLLAVGKLTFKGVQNRSLSNRIKGIIDVEIPYLKDQLVQAQSEVYLTESQLEKSNNILKHTNIVTRHVGNVARQLVTVEDYEDTSVLHQAEDLVQTEVAHSKDQIDYDLSLLIESLQQKHDSFQTQLVEDLESISQVILYTGITGAVLCVFIAFQVTTSISKSAETLVDATKKISDGDYKVQISGVKNNDEFGQLSKNFNDMARSLLVSFETIKKHAKEIEIHERNLTAVFNAAPSAKLLINSKGEIATFNEAFLKLFNLKSQTLHNLKYDSVIPKIQFLEVEDFILNPTLIENEGDSKEKVLSRSDKTIFYASIDFRRLQNSEGIFLLVSITDISDRKEKEKVILDQIDELKKINADLGQFAYVATHDIKVPLNNIESYLMFLQMDESITAKRSIEAINWIEKSVKQGSQTVQDLVQVTRERKQTDISIEEVSFSEIVDKVITDLQAMIEEYHAQIVIDLKVETINYNKLKTTSIVQNLLSNALKYHSKDRTPVIKVSSEKENGFVCLKVEDNGIGINLAKDKEKVFGLFKRANDDQPGSGLGLYLTKQNIENAGGKITVSSEEGKGSTFTVYFKN